MFDRLAWRRKSYGRDLPGLDDEEKLDDEDADHYDTPMGELARIAGTTSKRDVSSCRPAGGSTGRVPAYRYGPRRRVDATRATRSANCCRSLTARHHSGRGRRDRLSRLGMVPGQ